jgi:hypothetical protein
VPVIGIFIDRWNRVSALTFCMGLAAVGYLSLALIGNPLDPWSLIGQEAPKEARGSVIGAFNISVAIGILFITTPEAASSTA